MERRTFLTLCSGTLALGAVTRLGLGGAGGPFCHVSGEAVFPGAPLEVGVDASLPPGARLTLLVEHAGQPHVATTVEARAGERLMLETPYPHDDLVPGDYAVRLHLHARGGRLLETREVGTYRVVPFRFSA